MKAWITERVGRRLDQIGHGWQQTPRAGAPPRVAPARPGMARSARRWCARVGLLGLLAASGLPLAAHAQGGAGSAPGATATPPSGKPGLTLDDLTRIRTAPAVRSAESRGGRSRQEWADAFASARRELAELSARVDASLAKLSASSGKQGQTQYSPFGGGPATDPETQKLRAQLERDRSSRQAAEQRLRDLEVEAELSEVPRAWVDPKEGTASP